MEAVLAFENHVDLEKNKDIIDDVVFGKFMQVEDKMTPDDKTLILRSDQTLAPQYNETTQVIDFIDSMRMLLEFDLPPLFPENMNKTPGEGEENAQAEGENKEETPGENQNENPAAADGEGEKKEEGEKQEDTE